MGWSPDIGQEIRSSGGFLIPHPAVVDPEETFPDRVAEMSDRATLTQVGPAANDPQRSFPGAAAGASDHFTPGHGGAFADNTELPLADR